MGFNIEYHLLLVMVRQVAVRRGPTSLCVTATLPTSGVILLSGGHFVTRSAVVMQQGHPISGLTVRRRISDIAIHPWLLKEKECIEFV